MSYKALYRKYRPFNFNEIIGQDHIVKTLENIVISGNINHAYLFVGPHGTGKTTTAQVFARAVNCVDKYAEDKWANCKLIDWKTDGIDIVEIDAASNNGVAEIRNIIDNSRYVPSKLKKKVYIIDEIHMLSKGAFNALLKILEEPPKYVIFILATTEPEKIPPTILSRAQRYNFSRILNKTIEEQIKKILDIEKIKYENEAIVEISKLSNGSLRDALSIADQTSAYGNGFISVDHISKVFGIMSQKNQIVFLNTLSNKQIKETMNILRTFYLQGLDIYRLTISLIDIIKDWIIFDKTKEISLLTTLNEKLIYDLKINKNFAYIASEELFKIIKELQYSKKQKSLFELLILKIAELSGEASLSENKIENKEIEIVPQEEINTINFDINKKEKKEETDIFNKIKNIEKEEKLNFDLEKDETRDITIEESIKNLSKENPINLTEEILITSQIDVSKMFKNDKNKETEKNKNFYDLDFLMSLLAQAKKSKISEIKIKLNIATSFVSTNVEQAFITYLSETKVITVGENFVLLTSSSEVTIDELNKLKRDQDFILFMDKVLGKPTNCFFINKKQFENMKKEWVQRKQNNIEINIIPMVVDRSNIVVKKTNAEKLMQDLFES